MKTKIILSAIALSLLVVSIFPVRGALGDRDYQDLKALMVQALDNAISRIQTNEQRIQQNRYVDQATKDAVSMVMEARIERLQQYQTEVNATTTLTELRALNQEIVAYLRDNKDAIRAQIKEAIMAAAEKIPGKIDEFKQKVETIINFLYRTCPSERDTLDSISSSLDDLEAEVAVLKTAIQDQDAATVKIEATKINTLARQIVSNVKQVQQACIPESTA